MLERFKDEETEAHRGYMMLVAQVAWFVNAEVTFNTRIACLSLHCSQIKHL